ncbi:MAG: hypothetical protein Kilf2KO_26990 [Rhodospirillales bacterium]
MAMPTAMVLATKVIAAPISEVTQKILKKASISSSSCIMDPGVRLSPVMPLTTTTDSSMKARKIGIPAKTTASTMARPWPCVIRQAATRPRGCCTATAGKITQTLAAR